MKEIMALEEGKKRVRGEKMGWEGEGKEEGEARVGVEKNEGVKR